jgi:hypothetical protein
MTEKFVSKGSKALIIGSSIAIVVVMVLMLTEKAWAGVVIVACIAAFILHMFSTTYYIISGNELKVRSGFLINIAIDIDQITKITPTNNILSAPALSLDRLEIFYNKYDSVMISPENKEGFIAALTTINPQISI